MALIKNRNVPGGKEFWDHVEAIANQVPCETRLILAEKKLAEFGIAWEQGKGYVFTGEN